MSDGSRIRYGTAVGVGAAISLGFALGLLWEAREAQIDRAASPTTRTWTGTAAAPRPAADETAMASSLDTPATSPALAMTGPSPSLDVAQDPAIPDVTDEGEHVMWPAPPAAPGIGAEEVELIEGEPVAASVPR